MRLFSLISITDVSYGDNLTKEQKSKVRNLLYEESASFMREDQDSGFIDNLELKLHMKDETPVQRQYLRIPKPLYQEVKYYLDTC